MRWKLLILLQYLHPIIWQQSKHGSRLRAYEPLSIFQPEYSSSFRMSAVMTNTTFQLAFLSRIRRVQSSIATHKFLQEYGNPDHSAIRISRSSHRLSSATIRSAE